MSKEPFAATAGATAALPVVPHLPDIVTRVRESGAAVLVAPPGTGKTTLVPTALEAALGATVLVAQPRRVAARAAAKRIAALIGGGVGEHVGYRVRGDVRVGPDTRVEVMTTGLLVRRLQTEPDLPGVAAVIVDECHERHLDTDLALAFLADVRQNLRDDLAVLAMSATTDADRIAGLLGTRTTPVPVLQVPGATYPVTVQWCPPPPGTVLVRDGRVEPGFLRHVAATTRRAAQGDGDVLVFLPGLSEIAAVRGLLDDTGRAVQILHGSLGPAEQDEVLAPRTHARIILASAVAESSVTVPGVRAVVDAGLSREPRFDPARGLPSLVTVRVSVASARQRAGRAGRTGPGRVLRCWSEADHAHLVDQPAPEVLSADLTAFLLQLAAWGNPRGVGLALPDPPPGPAADAAERILAGLGAVDDRGRITGRGRRLLDVGVHPRLARALLDATADGGPADQVAEVVAILAADLDGRDSDDLTVTWAALRRGTDPARTRIWREESRRLASRIPGKRVGGSDSSPGLSASERERLAGRVVALAYPERLARRRAAEVGEQSEHLFTGGTAGMVTPGGSLAGEPWLAVARADRRPGERRARIRSAVAVDEDLARQVCGTERQVQVEWVDGRVRAREVERIGAIVLRERPVADPDPEVVAEVVREALHREGVALLSWTPAATALRNRIAACAAAAGAPAENPWPATDDAAILAALDLSRIRSRADLDRIDLVTVLHGMLPWQRAAELDAVAPVAVTVPSSRAVPVDYSDPEAPRLSVKLQELFGWTDTPSVAGRPLRIELLTPAGRTAAITTDLATFWRTGYPMVRAELRGRYPRHPWPEDPATAPATARAKPRRS